MTDSHKTGNKQDRRSEHSLTDNDEGDDDDGDDDDGDGDGDGDDGDSDRVEMMKKVEEEDHNIIVLSRLASIIVKGTQPY